VLDGQAPPDGVVEGVGDGDGDPAAVLGQHPLVPRRVRVDVLGRLGVRVLQLLS
jgi:hypothetical protein